MRFQMTLSWLLVVLATACVDRFSYDIEKKFSESVSISGFISDQPGPYEIKIYSVFDIESKESRKVPISVKTLEISDNHGRVEILNPIDTGIYQTSPTGMRGVVGNVYKLRVELFDGRVYESLPDTILAPGSLDSMYVKYTDQYNDLGVKEYGFDVFFDASYDTQISSQFIWKFTTTFQVNTHPELNRMSECFWLNGKCNWTPPCSGWRNVGSTSFPQFEMLFPCTCCQCWYRIYNDYLILSDNLFTGKGSLKSIKAQNIPLTQWTLFYKMRVNISQMSLTHNSFRFWKAIRNQQTAVGSLFQPITGIIPHNFAQLAGDELPLEGLFYATSISSKTQYITQFDLPPDFVYQFPLKEPIFGDDCRLLLPNNTTRKPSYWID